MPAAYVPIEIDQGEDWSAQITWQDDTGEPFHLRRPMRMDINTYTGQTILSLTVPDEELEDGVIPEINFSAEQGLIQLHIEDAVTAGLPAGSFEYDLFVTVADGQGFAGTQVTRLIRGPVTINKRVTRGF